MIQNDEIVINRSAVTKAKGEVLEYLVDNIFNKYPISDFEVGVFYNMLVDWVHSVELDAYDQGIGDSKKQQFKGRVYL